MSNGDDENKDGPRVVDLPERDVFKGAVDALERSMMTQLKYIGIQAKVRRAAYLALIKEGFTETQALELCRHP